MRAKILTLLAPALLAFYGALSASTPAISWENRGHLLNPEGESAYIERFSISGTTPFTRLAFCVNKHDMQPLNPLDTIIEILPGYYAVGSPRFADVQPADTVVVDIMTRGWMHNAYEAPDGMHLVRGNHPVAAVSSRKSFISRPEQWISPEYGVDKMVYGPGAFAINDSIRSSFRPGPFMQIPTLKSVSLKGKKIGVPALKAVRIEDSRKDYFRVDLDGDTATVFTNSSSPAAILAGLRRRMMESADEQGLIPAAAIEDWADFGYRGLMIDVARNFTGKEEIKKMLSVMARYGLNVLHFHLGDDEGWRVEIPGLPELTAVGSRRGYTVADDVDFLKQIYSGDGSPLSDTPANGHFSAEDFIDIIKFAYGNGISVIPEFDSPGHSRAAIRAMEYRYRTTGDDSMRLIHDGDTSRYTTAQCFTDNLMNPALEGPYRFWGAVMDGIISLYDKAGVPLRAIHVGGDEVPSHAWDGSDIATSFMKRNGMSGQRELFAYFFQRLAKMAAERNIRLSGWQELALGHSGQHDEVLLPVVESVNSWTRAGRNSADMAAKGYPVVMSNVDYLYFDQTPSTHPEEPGFIWGGIVDEFRPLHAYPEALCPGDEVERADVVGISAQLFAETIRNPAMLQRYIFPRLLGLAERAHNSAPTISDSQYFGILTGEMQRWAQEDIRFYLRQPGIRMVEGLVEMNEPYGFGEIRFTLDGSDPTPDSPLYEAPFSPQGASEVRARLYVGPSFSVTSILPLPAY